MIKIENIEVHGLEPSLRGMRNPKNSWDKSDSTYCRALAFGEMNDEVCQNCPAYAFTEDMLEEQKYGKAPCTLINNDAWPENWDGFVVGPNDHELAMTLRNGGPVHAKYRRMIIVYADITAPLYWWKEFDTYKVGTVANSCSTMHKIHAKEFTLDDFSHEHLIENWNGDNIEAFEEFGLTPSETNLYSPMNGLELIIGLLNTNREAFLRTKDKKYWRQMIQLLPSSYNQKRTVMFSYEMLANTDMYRSDHKLDEWREFCKWARTLPYSEFFHKEKEEIKEWIRDRTEVICPYCDSRFDDNIYFMKNGMDYTVKHCPECGKRIKV